MGQRSKVEQLPEEIRQVFHGLLRDGVEYREIAERLHELGYEIGKSSLHRYGTRFQERLRHTAMLQEQARAYVQEAGTGLALDEAAHQMAMDLVLQVLMKMGPESFDEESPVKLLQALGRLQSSGVQREKLKLAEQRQRAEQLVKDLEEDPEVRNQLSPETIKRIREQIYGIVD